MRRLDSNFWRMLVLQNCTLPIQPTTLRNHKKCLTQSFVYIFSCLDTLYFAHLGRGSPMSKVQFLKNLCKVFESTRKWPPIAPSPGGMLLLSQNSFFCHCCYFFVSPRTSLTINLHGGFVSFSAVVEIPVFKFCYFFVSAQLIMPRVNKRRRHSPNDTQATFGTKINLWRWKGKSSEQKIHCNKWI
jgi:hypothetical protein